MKGILDGIITEPLKDFIQNLMEFTPNLISAFIIFILGFIAASILKYIVVKALSILNTDRFCGKVGIGQVLERVGITETPSKLVGRICYWLVVVVFIIIALYALRVPAVEDLLAAFFIYLPNVFVAALVIFIGYLLGNFLGRTTLIASVNAGIKFSAILAKGVTTIVFLFAFAMALEQLGIGRDTVIVAFTILFGGLVFSLALAFGLGAKDIAKDFLDKKLKGDKDEGDEKQDELKHI